MIQNNKPKLLDLFCCAGGASMGYHRAGFEVVGVDIKPQPNYPFEFHQANALEYPLDGFDAYHASPPCQGYIHLKNGDDLNGYPLLIDIVRERLISTKKPYSIENVPHAKEYLINPIMLCGTMFGLAIWKHRYFETNPVIYALLNTCNHKLGKIDSPFGKVDIPIQTAHGGDSHFHEKPSRIGIRWRPSQALPIRKYGMGIDWNISKRELAESIPPAYTEYIGQYLIKEVERLRQSVMKMECA
jgi:DNA (cytosine-5)-methyltransferase 1